jgi:hypothetical protein
VQGFWGRIAKSGSSERSLERSVRALCELENFFTPSLLSGQDSTLAAEDFREHWHFAILIKGQAHDAHR